MLWPDFIFEIFPNFDFIIYLFITNHLHFYNLKIPGMCNGNIFTPNVFIYIGSAHYFATNSGFLNPKSLQHDAVDLRYISNYDSVN